MDSACDSAVLGDGYAGACRISCCAFPLDGVLDVSYRLLFVLSCQLIEYSFGDAQCLGAEVVIRPTAPSSLAGEGSVGGQCSKKSRCRS